MATAGAICRYSDMIRLLENGEIPDRQARVFAFDAKGQLVSGLRQRIPMLVRRRIALRSDFHRTLADVTEKLKGRLEPRLFPTNEPVEFRVDMRVDASVGDPEAIASAHWHPEFGPEDHFYAFFAGRLRILLEDSAHHSAGTIDQRIARYQDDWKSRLERELSEKFKIGVELRFTVETVVAPDIAVNLGEDVSLYVNFKDRIDKKYPFTLDLRLRAAGTDKPRLILKRAEEERSRWLAREVERICVEEITLHQYWFDAAGMEQVLQERLDELLADYGHRVRNLAVRRPWDETAPVSGDAKLPPLEEQKLATVKHWKDNQGNGLEFRAEGVIEIAADGAGLYDRVGRPSREKWFDDAIGEALRGELAGEAVTDLDAGRIETSSSRIEARIRQKAKQIGLSIELYFGSVYLPNNDWLLPRRVLVEAKKYPTAHPNIPGHFSIDMQIRFVRRKALEPFLRRRPDQTEEAVDKAVEDEIRNIAVESAQIVMKGIDANHYFAAFNKWDIPISSLGTPGSNEQHGENLVESKIKALLHRRHPDIVLESVVFHREDQAVEELRRRITELGNLKYDFTIVDRFYNDADRDRAVTGYVKILDGDASKVVMMLNKGFHEKDLNGLRTEILDDLRALSENGLAFAQPGEVEGLVESLTEAGGLFLGALKKHVDHRLRDRLRENYGLIAGNIEFTPALSDTEKHVREVERRRNRLPGDLQTLQIDQLQEQLTHLYNERTRLIGTDAPSGVDRENIARQIEDVEGKLRVFQDVQKRRRDPFYPSTLPNGAYEYVSPVHEKLLLRSRGDASRAGSTKEEPAVHDIRQHGSDEGQSSVSDNEDGSF